MELEVGKTYSTQQFIKALDISQSTWDRNREKYLDNLRIYYDFEVIYRGRRKFYKIVKKLGDYRKPPNKRSKEIRDEVYQKEITEVIECDPVQTVTNVARIINEHEVIIAFNHKEGTVKEYTRQNMKYLFGNGRDVPFGAIGEITERVWCRLDIDDYVYIRMKPEAIEAFKVMLKEQRKRDSEYETNVNSDYQAGLITKEQRDELIGDSSYSGYVGAQRRFYERFGYFPLKVPVFSIYANDCINFEDQVA